MKQVGQSIPRLEVRAKGLGESGTFGVSLAIANAIDDAVGVRITEPPITAEAVFRALRARAGRPLEDA
jgi:CO/xanthine dehydrogenase Mo-binding subunit